MTYAHDRACALCGNDLFREVRRKSLRHLHQCATCGLVCVKRLPEPDELRAVYGEAYFRNTRSSEMGYEDYEADRYCIVKTARRRLDMIERYETKRGRLLDVGCALGFFIDTAHKRGWAVDGVDISEHAVQYARDTLGLPARVGMLEDAGYPQAEFDVLTLWDVIEHVPDPVANLRYCASLLKERGLIVLSTPDVGSLVAKVAGARWMGYKLADEHLYYFSRRTLALALEKAGFELVELRGIGKDVSLEFFAKRLKIYVPPVAAALAKFLDASRLGRGSVYVNPLDIVCAIARKA